MCRKVQHSLENGPKTNTYLLHSKIFPKLGEDENCILTGDPQLGKSDLKSSTESRAIPMVCDWLMLNNFMNRHRWAIDEV